MINSEQINSIKEVVSEFLTAMDAGDFKVDVKEVPVKDDELKFKDLPLPSQPVAATIGAVEVEITLQEPQFLIGQDGKTLLDLQRILRMVVNRRLGEMVHVAVDINGYKAKKIDYVKKMAREAADQVALTKKSAILPVMSSYERRIVHAELSGRSDVTTQSQGDGFARQVVIIAK